MVVAAAANLSPAVAAQGAGDSVTHSPPAAGGAEGAAGLEAVTTKVLCPCGTCVNQTLHVCTCGTAAGERDRIAAALSQGRSPEVIVEAYVEKYGLQILTTPEKKGFNLIGWLVPFIVTVIALGSLTLILRGWIRSPAESSAPAPVDPVDSSHDPSETLYRDRLEKELKEYEV
jgi:cytochrome c-type biogenesis protein CcmH